MYANVCGRMCAFGVFRGGNSSIQENCFVFVCFADAEGAIRIFSLIRICLLSFQMAWQHAMLSVFGAVQTFLFLFLSLLLPGFY